MKIALIGNGKMGKTIAELLQKNGDTLTVIIDSKSSFQFSSKEFLSSDVAIEFTRPEAAYDNLMQCLDANIPVVCGTTGWYHLINDIRNKFVDKQGSLVYASNFSIGVNYLFEMNRMLATWMEKQNHYRVSINEAHHIHKLDRPSGTALTLVDDIIANNHNYSDWNLDDHNNPIGNSTIPIFSTREGNIIGDHEVKWKSAIDEITISHHANNREGFAEGALKAAHWLHGKKGVFTMKDVLFQPNTTTIS